MPREQFIINSIKLVSHLEGCMAEVGVWQGKTAAVIHQAAPQRSLHLYDTFKGIVGAIAGIDVHTNGEFADTSVEIVKAAIGTGSAYIKNVQFHVGEFPGTFHENNLKFIFVHSDTDTYAGTKATLNSFGPCMTSGGKILFHDYGWKACPGVQKAISEWLPGRNLKTELHETTCAITF